MTMKRAVSVLCSAALLFTMAGCSNDPEASGAVPSASVSVPEGASDYYEYLGNIDYSSDAAALVWEQVDGEDEGIFGIQYRDVIDFNGITSQSEIPVVLFFYSSYADGSQNLMAGVEDLAQTLVGQVLFIAVDGVEADAISTAYEVGGYPEFILLADNARISTFSGFDYEQWSIDDVTAWIEDNGYEPDMSMLLR
ncbi:MAG: hypothetical protein IKP14_05340 [Clostridiales bacterium]|nr:hypothetical protein [Clostridiales bacterium]